jgi:hypothetical protein
MVGLHTLDLLSDEVLPFKPDFAGGVTSKETDAKSEEKTNTRKQAPARSSSGFFSLLSGGSWFQATEPEHQVTAEERAHRKLGRECAASCELPQLVASSAQLPVEALRILTKSLISASTPKHLREQLLGSGGDGNCNGSTVDGAPSSVKSIPTHPSSSVGSGTTHTVETSQLVLSPAAQDALSSSGGGRADLLHDSSVHTFCLEYLSNVVLLNRHRILYVWVMTSDHLLRYDVCVRRWLCDMRF